MQDFVGVRVADAAEHARIGEHAFEGVIFARYAHAKLGQGAGDGIDTAGIERREGSTALDETNRSAAFAAGFGECQRSRVEREFRYRSGARLLARIEPVQTTGDHQVNDEMVVALEAHDDAFAEAAYSLDTQADEGLRSRRHSAQQKRVFDADRVECASHDALLQRFDVHHDVGILGHRGPV
jgi:hypothetical protein